MKDRKCVEEPRRGWLRTHVRPLSQQVELDLVLLLQGRAAATGKSQS